MFIYSLYRCTEEEKQVGFCHSSDNNSSAHYSNYYCNTASCCHSHHQCKWLQNNRDLCSRHYSEKGKAVTSAAEGPTRALFFPDWIVLKALEIKGWSVSSFWCKKDRLYQNGHVVLGQEESSGCLCSCVHIHNWGLCGKKLPITVTLSLTLIVCNPMCMCFTH